MEAFRFFRYSTSGPSGTLFNKTAETSCTLVCCSVYQCWYLTCRSTSRCVPCREVPGRQINIKMQRMSTRLNEENPTAVRRKVFRLIREGDLDQFSPGQPDESSTLFWSNKTAVDDSHRVWASSGGPTTRCEAFLRCPPRGHRVLLPAPSQAYWITAGIAPSFLLPVNRWPAIPTASVALTLLLSILKRERDLSSSRKDYRPMLWCISNNSQGGFLVPISHRRYRLETPNHTWIHLEEHKSSLDVIAQIRQSAPFQGSRARQSGTSRQDKHIPTPVLNILISNWTPLCKRWSRDLARTRSGSMIRCLAAQGLLLTKPSRTTWYFPQGLVRGWVSATFVWLSLQK